MYLIILLITNLYLVVITCGANILENNNPSFESIGSGACDSAEYWNEITTSCAGVTRSSAQSHTGTWCINFTDPTAGYNGRGVRSTNFSALGASPGSNYRAGGWFYVRNEAGAVGSSELQINILFLNSSRVQVGIDSKTFTNPAFSAWYYHDLTATAPANTAYVQVYIAVRETVNNNNDIYIDDFHIYNEGYGAGVYLPGDHKDWDLDTDNEFNTRYASPQYCRKVINPVFDNQFKISRSGWSPNWGDGFWITTYDNVWSINQDGGGGNAIWKGSPNNYITVVSRTNPSADPDSFGIMTTSAFPTYLTFVSNIGQSISHVTSVTINLRLDYAKCAQEYVFIRWTTNNWTTSSFSSATGAGTSYEAVIPPVDSGKSVIYYAMTSTANPPAAADADLLTLSFKYSDGDTNFRYNVINTLSYITNLISPKDGETGYYTRRPKFKWYNALDDDGDKIQNYHIWVDDNADFGSPIVNTDTGSTNSWYQIAATLNLPTTYYWRITAYDGADWGRYSQTNSFVIDPPFITVDGSGNDWGVAGYNNHTNVCHISNGIYMWKDANGSWSGSGNDVREIGGFDWGNCEIQDTKITADTNILYFYFKFLDLTSGGLSYITITLDTDQVSGSGNNDFAGNSETTLNPSAEWEKQIVCTINKTGVFDTSWNWNECGESWFDETTEVVEIGIPWEDLGITLPQKVRFSVAVGYKDTGDQMKETGATSDVLDCLTIYGPNTWDEVSDDNVWHYFDLNFNKDPYHTSTGSASGIVWPDHFSVESTRGFTTPGIEFSITNRAHSFDCNCLNCQEFN
ncbi:MAG: hypothetical protein KKH98_07680, partial [Spirochaetes bacterium]|nr:hypothetical protein [Spirochaetota bacterium]